MAIEDAAKPDEPTWVCLFPRLTGEPPGKGTRETTHFDPMTNSLLDKCSKQFHVAPHLVLAAVWAAVLRQYTEMDNPGFVMVQPSREGHNNYTAEGYSTQLDHDAIVQKYMRDTSWERFSLVQGTYMYNTALVIGDEQDLPTESVDISIMLQLEQQPPALSLAYTTQVVSTVFAEVVASAISQSIYHLQREPNVLLKDLDLSSPLSAEMVRSWQGCASISTKHDFMFEVIARQAAQRPNAVAVDAWDVRWTYQELEKASSQLAFQLQTRGVGTGVQVLMCFEKTGYAVLAMLAVNKTGGSFVPCDPSYPAERRRQILRRIHASVALTSPECGDLFSDETGLDVVTVPGCAMAPSIPKTVPKSCLSPTSPAYILYTSGSTGEPKGCEITHAAFASIAEHAEALQLSPTTRSLQFASFSFGMAIIEIFCTLAAGGVVCMLSADQRSNSLAHTMTEMKVNWAFMTPTVLSSLQPQDLPYLHDLFIAGEAMSEGHVRTWGSSVHVHQAYGLTEWSGIFAISDRMTVSHERATIGRPVNGLGWLVDPLNQDRLVPVGAPGELVISGPSLASGYFEDPRRSKASFISPAWRRTSTDVEDRLYRTGDIMRYSMDGTLQYIRRKDSQVKIRGLRVELGEVESNLLPLIPEAKRVIATVWRPLEDSHQQLLVAFVLLRVSDATTIPLVRGAHACELQILDLTPAQSQGLRDAHHTLRSQLPGYMIPQHLIPVAAVPTTYTGKVDRRKLGALLNKISPSYLSQLAGQRSEYQQPANEREQLIHDMTCSILGLKSASMQDNFFNISGDSVAAMKMVRLASSNKVSLTVAKIFKYPVLKDMAAQIGQRNDEPAANPVGRFGLLLNATPTDVMREVAEQTHLDVAQVLNAYPCTPLQEGLCALSVRDQRAYKARIVCQVEPSVDISAVRQAWERIFEMNDILRTRLVASSSHGTIQAVMQENFQWDYAENLDEYSARVSKEPMGIGHRLVRACLLADPRTKTGPATLVLTLHHAICDRWSVGLLLEQLERQLGLTTKPVLEHHEFLPFIEHLADLASKHQEYWNSQFHGIEAQIFPELPSPYYDPVVNQTLTTQVVLPERNLRDKTVASHVRLALALAIAHHTCSDDIIFGATVSGRAALMSGIERMSGPTIATIPLRIALNRENTVAQSLSAIQAQSIETIPFEQAGLQNIRKYSSESDYACKFQTHLTIQPALCESFALLNVIEQGPATPGGFASYALCLECYLEGDEKRMKVMAAFDSNVISSPRVARFINHLEFVLHEIMKNPDQLLSSVSHINPSDMSQLWEWNTTLASKPKLQDSVHKVVQERAHETPAATAICAHDRIFTYRDLETRATHLAGELLRRGVRRRTLVPLLFEKSAWAIVSMLAVIKAGAGIVALDPSYPLGRSQAICEQVGSSFALCSKGLAITTQKLGCQPVVVSEEAPIWGHTIEAEELPPVGPSDILYLIFTSGSTGAPKGVIVEHGCFASSTAAYSPEIKLRSDSRMLQFCSFAFDCCFVEIFGTLMTGGCLCVPSDQDRTNNIHNAIRELQISHAVLTPSVARLVQLEPIPSLKVLMLAGEPVSASDVEYWSSRVYLVNGYGPSECAPISATQHNDGSNGIHARDIGRTTGCIGWVCDPRDHGILVPIGATGELILEGPNVGPGYFKNPSETESAFINSPPWLRALRKNTSRVYKTKDLVRYTEDGRLQYVGRIGHQVKIRGQRLDPSHVESQLLQHFGGAIKVAAVVATPGNANNSSSRAVLVGFILTDEDQTQESRVGDAVCAPASDSFSRRATSARLKLQKSLPEFMVPSLLIPLRFMPQTPSGKLDRLRLRQEITSRTWKELMQHETASGGESVEMPSTDAERELQMIWSRVLSIPPENVGVNQPFLTCGGDSITAMLVVTQARRGRLGLNITVDDIFNLHTISRLADHAATTSVPYQLSANGVGIAVDVPFPLSPIQHLFFSKNPQGSNRFSHNILLHLEQPVTLELLRHAGQNLAEKHPMLRARFSRDASGQWHQFVHGDVQGSVACRIHRLRTKSSVRRILAQSREGLDILAGPVFSLDLIQIDGRQSIFALAHHLVIDMVSWPVLLADLEVSLRGGSVQSLPSTSYQTWCRILAESTSSLSLPPVESIDSKEITSFWGVSDNLNVIGLTSEKVLNIDGTITNAVLGKANDAFGTQPVELIHAAILHAFITTFPSRKAPAIYSEGHGREPGEDTTVDITSTVGWFTSIAPVCVQPKGPACDLSMVVRQVKDARRQSPRNGLEAFTANYYNSNNMQVDPAHTMEITFNYGGRYHQQLEQTCDLFSIEPLQNLGIFDAAHSVARWSFVDINAFVHDEELNLAFTFPKGCSQAQVLGPWMNNIRNALRRMASEFVEYPRSFTMTDFSCLNLSYEELDALRSRLTVAGIHPENVEDIYPCAPIQRGILLSRARNPDLYHIAMTWVVKPPYSSAPPSAERARSAITQVIARHAFLRTYFTVTESEDSMYDQVVVREMRPEIPVTYSEKSAQQALSKADETFRPSTECPYRFSILVSGDKRVYIRLDITHALVDAHTLEILERELCLAYDGKLGVDKAPCYSSYISFLRSQDREADRGFWQQYLAGSQSCLFPALTGHCAKEPDSHRDLVFEIGNVDRLRTYCKSRSVTVANVFSLAWALILRAYVGETDVCFGFLVSGRELPFAGASDVGGPLINMLTTRLRLAGDARLCELLQGVQADFLACRRHQTYPIGDIIHDQGSSESFKVNTALSVQRVLEDETPSTGTAMSLVHRQDPSEYAIAMNVEIEKDRIVCHFRYWLSNLSDAQASLVASSFDQAVSQIVSNDQATPSEVNLLSPHHRDLIWNWNGSLASPGPACVHEIIRQRVVESPSSPAVVTTEGALSYGTLETLSDRLAHYLVQIGVVSEMIVPCCFDKGTWTVVAVLAVLKAGGAFALMDTMQPDHRLESICADANSPIILASVRQAPRCAKFGKKVVAIGGNDDDRWNRPLLRSKHFVHQQQPNSKNAMFVVYTSGSTGKPKGVIIEHGSFHAMIQAQSPLWYMTATARLMQFASYAFDASVLEMLLPLMLGATTCILTEVERRDHLRESIVQLGVTHAFLTPSVARLLSPAMVPNLAVLICVGEPMTQLDLDEWANDVRLINAYGPAECTIGAITQPIVTTTSRPGDIGRPAGCAAWVVDLENSQCLVPIGAVGELIIEGPTVGRGYLNNPQATAAAFLSRPSWLRDLRGDTRIYKTGDLVRYGPDGQLYISGRKDTQVKIRGQRIELGEIEYQVHCAFKDVQDVIVEMVLVGPEDNKTPTLFALISGSHIGPMGDDPFLVPDETFKLQASSASASLFQKLPAYMVPSYFIPLSAIPVGPSGKADRKQLRRFLANLQGEQLKMYRPTGGSQRTVTSVQERVLHGIWCNVLGVELEDIGSDDNFFQIGGDSVNAMRVAAMARKASLNISVADIFAHPKLSSLSRLASTIATEHFEPVPFSLNPVSEMDGFNLFLQTRRGIPACAKIVDILPTSAAQAFFLERPTLHHFAFAIEGSVDVEKLHKACAAVYQSFSLLRTLFLKHQDQTVQVILDDVPVPFHHFVTDQPPARLLEVIRDADRENMPLYGQLPFAFILISHRDSLNHSLVCRAAHPQWDGLSVGQLFKSISDAYLGIDLIPTTPLSTLVHYRLRQQTVDPSLRFWRNYLRGATITRLTQLPPHKDLSQGTTIWENTNMRPSPLAPKGITMASVVKAAWALVLSQESKTNDIVFGQTVNGRNAPLPDIDMILGCCLNFAPVRIRLDQIGSISDLLSLVQNQYQQTVQHDEIELPTIIERCTPWARETDLHSIVQHQNIPLTHDLSLGRGLKTQFSLNGYFRPGKEVFIFTEPMGDILSVQLCVNPNVIGLERASGLHRRLVKLIGDLCYLDGGEAVEKLLKVV
ncbi:nonribosomal peptide synthase [Aspergillus ustus]|uniref:Nonribosomal peptide synthase n=1 Tax=Aspergillus ustus TaxID=40382 RepID=A0A0C1E6G4_ASPUT|nr:nonribosomal peptide synthase [Aspergillus ustus]